MSGGDGLPRAPRPAWPALVFAAWWAALVALLLGATLGQGTLPVDYATYATAAERAGATGSPYAAEEDARAVWSEIHRTTVAMFERAAGAAVGEGAAPAPVSGPYLYPPTLALLLPEGPWAAAVFVAILAGATVAATLAWLRWAGAGSALWLLPVALSADVLASVAGGNVELLCFALALLGCRLLWRGRGLSAGVAMAAAVLLKPVFAPLLLGFAILSASASAAPRAVAGRIVRAALAGGVVLALEVLRWPEPARADFLAYLAEPMARQYLALPPPERWPMEVWNRSPVQALVTAGLSPGAAQAAALALWAALLGASAWLLRGRRPGFAALFALAYALFFLVRPIAWSLPFLDVVVLAAAWPVLAPWARIALAFAAAALAASHWAAFALFAAAEAPGLLTLQTPAVPWETALVLPGAALLALWAARARGLPRG